MRGGCSIDSDLPMNSAETVRVDGVSQSDHEPGVLFVILHRETPPFGGETFRNCTGNSR